MIKILSMDGGGVRGIMSICILKEIEKNISKPIQYSFDYMTGTSIGGIIVSALAVPNEHGSFKYNATYLCDFLTEHASDVFPKKSFLKTVKTVFGFRAPKYDHKPLEHLLESHLGDLKLNDTLIPISLHTVSVNSCALKTWSTFAAAKSEAENILLKEAARATSAAPTYFAPKEINGQLYVDGGLVANNPAIPGLLTLKEHLPKASTSEIIAVSVGTGSADGQSECKSFGYGLAGWMLGSPNIVSLTLNANEAFLCQITSTALEGSYHRLQPMLNGNLPELDDISTQCISTLRKTAEMYFLDFTRDNQDFLYIFNHSTSLLGDTNE